MLELKEDVDIWYIKQFRYCPLCLAHGFHSYLFQWRSLVRCPMHDVALTTKCQFCESGLGKYELSSEGCYRAYLCIICWRPISGVAPSLDLHLDLHEVPSVLSNYFEQYGDWWEQTAPNRAEARSLRGPSCRAKQSQWFDVGRLLRSVASQGMVAPASVDLDTYPSAAVTVLEWRCQIRVSRPWLGNLEAASGWSRRPTYEAVYRSTLRMLTRWINAEDHWRMATVDEAACGLRTRKGQEYSAKLAALHYLRMQLEYNFEAAGRYITSTCPEPKLYRELVCNIVEFKGRTSRLAWRAAFLALYASWYHRIASGKLPPLNELARSASEIDNQIFNIVELRCRLQDKWYVGEVFMPDEAWFYGRVAFLRVPGMPLSFFGNRARGTKWHRQQLS